MMVLNRNLLFQGSIFRFHVSFRGCRKDSLVLWKTQPFFWVDFEKEHMTGLVTNSFFFLIKKKKFPQRITFFFLESSSISKASNVGLTKKKRSSTRDFSIHLLQTGHRCYPWEMVFWWLPMAQSGSNAQLGPSKRCGRVSKVLFWTKARQIDPVELNTSIEKIYGPQNIRLLKNSEVTFHLELHMDARKWCWFQVQQTCLKNDESLVACLLIQNKLSLS